MAFSVSQKLNLLLSLVYNRGHCKNCPHKIATSGYSKTEKAENNGC